MNRASGHLAAVFIALIVMLGRWNGAKEIAQLELPIGDRDPAVGSNSDAAEGVFVRDSVRALDKFTLGQRMERLREWNKAADVFQEILEKDADAVVQSKTDQNGHAYQYKSVTIAVQERLAHWPAEGLRVYKARFEPAAQAMLEGAKRDDYETLHKVFSLYFATDSGKKAGMRLIDLYLENGDFAAAAWMADRLLAFQPDLAIERPRVLYRAALAYHLGGDEKRAQQKLEELKVGFVNSTGTIRGKDVILVESLQAELGTARPAARSSTADSWPIFMGDEARSRVSTGQGRTGARAFVSVEMAKVPTFAARGRRVGFEPFNEVRPNSTEIDTASLGVLPVVDRNELYFSDGSNIYAVSLESGLPLPQWQQTYPEKMGRYAAFNTPAPRRGQYTVTVTDDSVLAVLGTMSSLTAGLAWGGVVVQQAGGGAVGVAMGDREARLVCLDRASGKLRWTVQPKQQLPGDALQKLTLCGSPLVVGDNVYITGRGGKSAQFEDCYVLCFDLNSGKYRWSCYVASSNLGMIGLQGDP